MRIPKQSLKHDEAFQNRPDLTKILHFSPAEPIVAPPTQPSEARPSAPQITPILREGKRTIQVCDTADSDTSSLKRSKRQTKKHKRTSDSQSNSIIQIIQKTEGYSTETPISDTTIIWCCIL